MSPELDTLDQLLGGDMELSVIRGLYDSGERFARAVEAMLHAGEVTLLADGVGVPRWRWIEVLAVAREQGDPNEAWLSITDAGVRQIGG